MRWNMSGQPNFSLEIRYCVSWNYKPKAASLAEKLQDEYECNVTIIPGDRGEFSVWFHDQSDSNPNNKIQNPQEKNGLFIIGKKEYDFPTHNQVISAIDKKLDPYD